jgi:hypothetical protein
MKQAKTYHKTHVKNGKEYHVTMLTDLGRAEKEADEAMALVKSTKYNPAKADAFRKECKIGEYREWEWDMVRLKEINDMVVNGEATMHPRMVPKTGVKHGRKPGGTNITIGKKQRERIEQQLIHQLNNE